MVPELQEQFLAQMKLNEQREKSETEQDIEPEVFLKGRADDCRHGLANKVMSEVDKHKNGNSVDTEVSYKDDCSIM